MHRHYPWVSFLCAVSALIPAPALAQITADPNGTGTQVTQTGQQFDISGGTTSRNGHNLFHLFREFGLNTGQTANFLSTPQIRNILAGVNGGNASYINGLIQVSGGTSNLYLINPAGIVFGSNARLNVPAAFHASTASRVHFEGGIFDLFSQRNDYANLVGNPTGFEFNSKGILINEGHLSVREGQSLTLMAHQVINTGTLSAPGGTVTVQAVPETGMVRVSQEGTLLSLEIPQDRVTGEIAAVDLPRLLTGGPPEQRVNSVIQNPDGTISLVHDPNRVSLPMQGATAVIGGGIEVAHPVGMGGNVNVLGRNIALVGATINAAGNTGGGTILVGGDYLGGTTGTNRLDSSFNAQNLFVDSHSVLTADAISQGNGGTVINWADNSTQFYGTITARGGELGGDGGFVETSGRELLGVSGTVDASAPRGNPGLWLLDPHNVTINSTSTTDFSGGTFTPTANNATVLSTTINTALDAGTSVTITTGDTGFQAGNITVNAPISKTMGGDATLTLAAANSIFVNANITSTSNKLNIVLNADTNNILGGAIIVNNILGGAIIVNGVTLDSNGGNITLGGGDDPLNNPAIGTLSNVSGIELNGATLTAEAGNITLHGQGRDAVTANSHGISINNSRLETTSGNITLVGEGGNRLLGVIDNNSGISISNSTIQSDSGLISLDGTGGSSPIGANNSGVILTDSTIANNEGNISIAGQAGNALLGTLNNNVGIIVSGSNIENQQGNIELRGFGGNSLLGASNIGIYINNNSQISNNEGYIYLSGIGGASLTNLVTNNDGVHIADSDISNTSGTIEISGEGGISLLGSNNVGLRLLNSTLKNDMGNIDLSGTGGESLTGNTGILQEGTTVKTTSGDIVYEAEGTGAATGLIVVSNSFIGDGTSGDINLVADTMELDGVTIQGSSHLTIQPLTLDTTIGIGDGAIGTLYLSNTALDTIQAGFSQVTIGHANGSGTITVEGYTFNNSLQLRNPNGGGIAIHGALSVGTTNNLTLHSGGAVTQGLTAPITANGLELLGTGDFTLDSATNNVTTLAGNTTGAISYTNSGSLTVGTVNTTTGIQASGNITLTALGSGDIEVISAIMKTGTSPSTLTLQAHENIIIDADITATDGVLNLLFQPDFNQNNSGGVLLCNCVSITTNNGNFTIGSPTNPAVGTPTTSGIGIEVSATIETGTGNIAFYGQGQTVDNSDTNYGVLLNASSIETTSGHIFLSGIGGGGMMAANSGIVLFLNELVTDAGNITLEATGTGNAAAIIGFNPLPFPTIASTSGTIVLTSLANGMDLSTLMIETGATLHMTSAGAVVQPNGQLLANHLDLSGTGDFILDSATNNVTLLSKSGTGNLTFTDTDGFETTGLTAPTAILSAGGPITQSGPITVTNLAILGTGNTELTNPNNQIQRLAANTTGNLTVVNSGTLTVDTVNPNGIESANTVFLRSMGGNIVLNQPISASGNITLVAAQNFINNVGSAPLVVGSGNRWLVYATSPQGNVNGWPVMGGSEAFGLSYPQSPSFSGSGFVYTSAAPPAPPIPPEPINPVPPPNPINPPSPDPINPVTPPQPIIPVPPDDSRFEGELGRELFGQEPTDSVVAEALCEFAGEEEIINLENLANPDLIFLPECS